VEAEARKRIKYLSVLNPHSFAPVAVETLGHNCSCRCGDQGADAEDLLAGEAVG